MLTETVNNVVEEVKDEISSNTIMSKISTSTIKEENYSSTEMDFDGDEKSQSNEQDVMINRKKINKIKLSELHAIVCGNESENNLKVNSKEKEPNKLFNLLSDMIENSKDEYMEGSGSATFHISHSLEMMNSDPKLYTKTLPNDMDKGNEFIDIISLGQEQDNNDQDLTKHDGMYKRIDTKKIYNTLEDIEGNNVLIKNDIVEELEMPFNVNIKQRVYENPKYMEQPRTSSEIINKSDRLLYFKSLPNYLSDITEIGKMIAFEKENFIRKTISEKDANMELNQGCNINESNGEKQAFQNKNVHYLNMTEEDKSIELGETLLTKETQSSQPSTNIFNNSNNNSNYINEMYKFDSELKKKSNITEDKEIDYEDNDYLLQSRRIKTSDVKPNKNLTFNEFNLRHEIIIALEGKGWKWPSPVQECVIPRIMEGQNLIARSKNGTGKTGAYAISLLNNINIIKKVQVIILVPTRELALQTANECISISQYCEGLNVMATTGGTNLTEDIYRLHNEKASVHVVVATPQRILDLLRNNEIYLEDIKTLVLDEADKLLSSDYQDIISRIIKWLPTMHQKVLLSATFPVNVKHFVDKYMKTCRRYNLMNELTLKGISQFYAYVKEDQKVSCLRILLSQLDVKQSIIFCNSTKRVELLAQKIISMGYSCFYIHSKLDQLSRNKVFHDFRQGFITYLVCTDIMTRGIDVPDVNVVINFDFPKYAETYLHRIGRCGRFGHLAIAINLITDVDKENLLEIEEQIETKIKTIPKDIPKRLYVPSFQTKEIQSKFVL